MNIKMIRCFMDILILGQLRNKPMSGYDVIEFIHKKFHILVSSGTIYSTLYSMERDGLIEGMWEQRKRVYILTDKGEEKIKIIQNANEKIQRFIADLLA